MSEPTRLIELHEGLVVAPEHILIAERLDGGQVRVVLRDTPSCSRYLADDMGRLWKSIRNAAQPT